MLYLNQDDNNTYLLINNQTKDQIIAEHKLQISKHEINLTNYMEDGLPVLYWTPKMHKNPISFCFIITSPVCSIKSLSKPITSIFKMFYEKVERHHTEGKVCLSDCLSVCLSACLPACLPACL